MLLSYDHLLPFTKALCLVQPLMVPTVQCLNPLLLLNGKRHVRTAFISIYLPTYLSMYIILFNTHIIIYNIHRNAIYNQINPAPWLLLTISSQDDLRKKRIHGTSSCRCKSALRWLLWCQAVTPSQEFPKKNPNVFPFWNMVIQMARSM